MTIVRAMAVLQGPSGLARDRYINTWHFDVTATSITPDVATNIGSSLDLFYGPVDGFIRSQLDRVDYRLYDLNEPEPREPTLVAAAAQPSGLGEALPFEVATCLSFYGGRNLPRRRGRIYLGPLTTACMESKAGNGEPGPSLAFRTAMLDGAEALGGAVRTAGGDGAGSWVVYSPTAAAAGGVSTHAVSDAWVDDAFDTQRRRGDDPTTRTTRSIPLI